MIDRNTYWLLDSAIRSPKPLQLIHPDHPGLAAALNRSHHGMTYDTLVTLLLQLFRTGYLVVERLDPDALPAAELDDETWAQSLFVPTEAEIHQTLAGALYLQYAVTAVGGAAWEQVSAPNWRQYSVTHGTDHVFIAGGNKPLVERLMWLEPRIRGNYEIITHSLVWTEERPWHATYWKTVPEGYTVRFRIQPKPGDASNPIDFDTYDASCREWTQLMAWYTPYAR